MSRAFKVFNSVVGGGEKVYSGFDRDFDPVRLEHVVLVLTEGELDVYAVDDPKKVSGLVEYLEARNENLNIIGCYSRRR